MGTRHYKPVYNYRIVFEKNNGHIDSGLGWALTVTEAIGMFNSVRAKLDSKRLKKSTLYFENQLIKKL